MEPLIDIAYKFRAAIMKMVAARPYAVYFWICAALLLSFYSVTFPDRVSWIAGLEVNNTTPKVGFLLFAYSGMIGTILLAVSVFISANKEVTSEASAFRAYRNLIQRKSAIRIHSNIESIRSNTAGNIVLKTALSASNDNDWFVPTRDIDSNTFAMFRIIEDNETSRSHRRLNVAKEHRKRQKLCVLMIVDNSIHAADDAARVILNRINSFCDAVSRLGMPTIYLKCFCIRGTRPTTSNFISVNGAIDIKLDGSAPAGRIIDAVRKKLTTKPKHCENFDRHIHFAYEKTKKLKTSKIMVLAIGAYEFVPFSEEVSKKYGMTYFSPIEVQTPLGDYHRTVKSEDENSTSLTNAFNKGQIDDQLLDTLSQFSPYGRSIYTIEWSKEDADLNLEHTFAVQFRLTFGDRAPITKTSLFPYFPASRGDN